MILSFRVDSAVIDLDHACSKESISSGFCVEGKREARDIRESRTCSTVTKIETAIKEMFI